MLVGNPLRFAGLRVDAIPVVPDDAVVLGGPGSSQIRLQPAGQGQEWAFWLEGCLRARLILLIRSRLPPLSIVAERDDISVEPGV